MLHFIEFEMEGGNTVFVEMQTPDVEEYEEAKVADAGDGERRPEIRTGGKFVKALDVVRTSGDVLIQTINGLSEKPDEVEVTFGLTAAGEIGGTFLGFVVAKSSMDSSFTVRLQWNPKKDSKQNESEMPT